MKLRFRKDLLISCFLCLGIGLVVGWGFNHYLQANEQNQKPEVKPKFEEHPERFFDDFFNDDFFRSNPEPFEEMRRMHEEMFRFFDQRDSFQGHFDDWYEGRFGGGSLGDIKKSEDKDFVYYTIDIKPGNLENVAVEVGNGMVTIKATQKKTEKGDKHRQYFSSNFQRSFPVPHGVNEDDFNMEHKEDKIIVKFPKK